MADPVRDFLADDTGDLAVVNGDFAFVAGEDAIPQGIECRVRTFLGEILLDQTQGVPYIDDILVKNPDPNVVTEDLREAIANTPDVTNVVTSQALQITTDRVGTISYGVQTVYSTETLTGAVEDVS